MNCLAWARERFPHRQRTLVTGYMISLCGRVALIRRRALLAGRIPCASGHPADKTTLLPIAAQFYRLKPDRALVRGNARIIAGLHESRERELQCGGVISEIV